MSSNLLAPSLAMMRWHGTRLIAKTGTWPLVLLVVPVILALGWLGWLAPQNTYLEQELSAMQQKLKAPLPVIASDEPSLQGTLSVTEYQEVKMLFAIFAKYHLQAKSSHYHFTSAGETSGKTLQLSVPLEGNWPDLTKAIKEISQALPVTVERITAKRKQTDGTALTLTLQLTLRRG
ncbi:hypothetical protein [Pantoea endophytica]|uniref:hypothetical protein n=1 Tax=Pantoea endophytica TaxID=92488 RepID=UPI0030162F47